MESYFPIIIEETVGVCRVREPVSMGVPFPEGLLYDLNNLRLRGHEEPEEQWPVQCAPLATWPDGSLKWVLLDFQATVEAFSSFALDLTWGGGSLEGGIPSIAIGHTHNSLCVDTGAAAFWINRSLFFPFERVVINDKEILDPVHSWTRLLDAKELEYSPRIEAIEVESSGPLRSTIKVTGSFDGGVVASFATFCCRLHFFADSTLVRLDFTLLNPCAATHPGGLWDLGDSGSVFFKDLSLSFSLAPDDLSPEVSIDLVEEWEVAAQDTPVVEGTPDIHTKADLLVYQDSSGGVNWRSRNHVNKDGEVRTSFQGFAVVNKGILVSRGGRAVPSLGVTSRSGAICGTMRHFWQNFPSAIEVEGDNLTLRLFPKYFNDCFELQGGERKTQTLYLQFNQPDIAPSSLTWSRQPLLPRITPEWYATTGAIPGLVPRTAIPSDPAWGVIDAAVSGEHSFLSRREIIDEYGWRNFGDFYADHEAVGDAGPEPLISHYNNQYDGIWGCLLQFLASGDSRWFSLGDDLCAHVTDIDIYHTDADRPEYNHGMFWHTEHYIDAETATHRCFSRKHEGKRNLAHYGGGPSPSHNYSSGLLLHHYLTGKPFSREALLELAEFAATNLALEQSVLSRGVRKLKKGIAWLKQGGRKAPLQLVDTNKVYGFDGPGRASGNALNTLIDAFALTGDHLWIVKAAQLITRCVSPTDDLAERDLLDVENRWMYTVFLQALGKFLELPSMGLPPDSFRQEAKHALLHYARWMLANECFYFDQQHKLEFPNETWAAQELRKCNVLLYGSRQTDDSDSNEFLKAAAFFSEGGLNQLLSFDTRFLTRPTVLLLQNIMMLHWCRSNPKRLKPSARDAAGQNLHWDKGQSKISHLLKNEMLFVLSFLRR